MEGKFILSEIFIKNFKYPDLANLKVLNWLVCSKKLTSNSKTDFYTAAFVKWWCKVKNPLLTCKEGQFKMCWDKGDLKFEGSV